jgi:DNA ligase (NAD+)
MGVIKISEPTVCPFCGSSVVRLIGDGAHLYCSNPNCKERKLQQLNYFVTKQCMNIDGLSEKTLRKLQTSGTVTEWKDLYMVTYTDLLYAGIGEKTAMKLIDEVEKSRTAVSADTVLMALGIPMIGKVTAQKLLEHFISIKNIENAPVDEIANVEGVGDVAAQYIYDYMHSHKLELQYVYKYLTYEFTKPTIQKASTALDGLTILATGTLDNFTRDSIKQSIIENGGKYASGVSGKLSYLLVGKDAGASKLNKAKDLGIKTITEDEYLKLIGK